MGLYLCNTCGSTLVKSGEHKPLSEIYLNAIPFKNLEKCPICNKVENLMYYPEASLVEKANSSKTATRTTSEIISSLQQNFNELNKAFADFRADVRGALFPFWPNNPGVSDSEIIDAIDRCVKLSQKER